MDSLNETEQAMRVLEGYLSSLLYSKKTSSGRVTAWGQRNHDLHYSTARPAPISCVNGSVYLAIGWTWWFCRHNKWWCMDFTNQIINMRIIEARRNILIWRSDEGDCTLSILVLCRVDTERNIRLNNIQSHNNILYFGRLLVFLRVNGYRWSP